MQKSKRSTSRVFGSAKNRRSIKAEQAVKRDIDLPPSLLEAPHSINAKAARDGQKSGFTASPQHGRSRRVWYRPKPWLTQLLEWIFGLSAVRIGDDVARLSPFTEPKQSSWHQNTSCGKDPNDQPRALSSSLTGSGGFLTSMFGRGVVRYATLTLFSLGLVGVLFLAMCGLLFGLQASGLKTVLGKVIMDMTLTVLLHNPRSFAHPNLCAPRQ